MNTKMMMNNYKNHKYMNKIKKTATTFILAIYSIISYSQKDSIYIKKTIDNMEDKVYCQASRLMICMNTESKVIGFYLFPIIDFEKEKASVSGLAVVMKNIGSCVENNEIIILFEDDSKIKLKSWNDFNCDGNAWFNTNSEDLSKLSSLKIKKIKVQNGRTYDSYTHEIKQDSDYFIQVFYAINNNKFKVVKK